MTATEACIALNMLPTMGPVRLRKLLEVFKEPQQSCPRNASELRKVEGIGNEVADQISNWESTVDLAAELKRVRDFGATVITQESPSYPKSLREIHAPPIVLYVWGELQERDHHAIGIIGSRRTTHYGTESAKKLAYQLAYAGLTVVSGLARGIDTAAHQGALAAKGRTIAVHRLGIVEVVSAGKSRPGGKNLQRQWRGRVRVFDGNRTGPTNFPDAQPDHFRLESRSTGGRSRFEQRRADHRGAGVGAGPFGLCRPGPHQCAERDGIEPADPAGREAGDGCERHS